MGQRSGVVAAEADRLGSALVVERHGGLLGGRTEERASELVVVERIHLALERTGLASWRRLVVVVPITHDSVLPPEIQAEQLRLASYLEQFLLFAPERRVDVLDVVVGHLLEFLLGPLEFVGGDLAVLLC